MDRPEFVEDMRRTDDHYYKGVLYDTSKCLYCQATIYETNDFEWVDGSYHSAECDGDQSTFNKGMTHVARLQDIHPHRRKHYNAHWLEGSKTIHWKNEK